ncbi:MAG: hypothetical protein IKC64_03615 [Clostridia bacterium]|nr:hypothetical protein [Clostridia bacterium]
MKNNKKSNIFARYFANFGLRQICDILMVLGALTLLVGLFVSISAHRASVVILTVGLCIYIVGCIIALVRTVSVLVNKKINHRSPEYKKAIINTVIMGLIFALAVFGLIYILLV